MKPTWRYFLSVLLQGALFALASPVLHAQTATGGTVSRKEYEELKAEMLAMKEELAALKKAKQSESNQETPKSQPATESKDKEFATTTTTTTPTPETAAGTTKF